MKDFAYNTRQVQFHHQKAVECWGRTLYHAWWCGKHLWEIKKRVRHGNFGAWLKENFKGSERTARYYMRLAKGYKEPPQNADITIRDALKGLTARSGPAKPFDPDDILRSQAFKAFLRSLFADWKQTEIDHLKTSLGMDGKLESLVVDAMKNVHRVVRRQMGKKDTAEDIERVRVTVRLMAQESLFAKFDRLHPEYDICP